MPPTLCTPQSDVSPRPHTRRHPIVTVILIISLVVGAGLVLTPHAAIATSPALTSKPAKPPTPPPTAPAPKSTKLPTATKVLRTLDDLYRSKSSHATLTMTVVKRRRTRSLTLEMWTRGQEQALIVIRKPAREAGTATLKNKAELYNYAPRADRLIRIPSGLLGSSWMGSHFSNDDLVRDTSWDKDYSTTLSWKKTGSTRNLLATMIPKPGAPVVYTKVLFLMDPTYFTPIRSEFYDRGKLIRTMTYSDVKRVNGRRIPHRMVVLPAKKPKERTELVYTRFELDIPVPAATFTKRGLRRAAKR